MQKGEPVDSWLPLVPAVAAAAAVVGLAVAAAMELLDQPFYLIAQRTARYGWLSVESDTIGGTAPCASPF